MSPEELDKALDPHRLSGGLFDTGVLPSLSPEVIAGLEAQLDEADRRDLA